jgi:hypothetical protein
MSEYMLDDYNQINDINPFVVKDFSLPGTWSDPYKFAPQSKSEGLDSVAQWDVPYKSPACSMVALGDKTVSFCNPGEPNCPMSRPLVPEQLYDPGMWNYYPKKKPVKPVGGFDITWLLVLVLVLILLWSARR